MKKQTISCYGILQAKSRSKGDSVIHNGNLESKEGYITNFTGFEYGGMHFVPFAKLCHEVKLADIICRSDRGLGFVDFHYQKIGILQKFPYSYADFYEAMKGSEMDIFKCAENGKLYIPGEHELFIYEGCRKCLVKD